MIRSTPSVAQDTATDFALGTSADTGDRVLSFVLDKPLRHGSPSMSDVAVRAAPFARVDDGLSLWPASEHEQNGTGTGINAWAQTDPGGRTGQVMFCIPPEMRVDMSPGSYAGTIVFADPRLARAEPIPVTISLSYTHREHVILVGLGVCLLTSFYVFFLRQKDPDEEDNTVLRTRFRFFHGYWQFATGAIGLLTIAAGLAAAITAFSKQYEAAEVWSGGFGDWLTFAAAVGTAFLAGGTAGKLAGTVYDKRNGTAAADGSTEGDEGRTTQR